MAFRPKVVAASGVAALVGADAATTLTTAIDDLVQSLWHLTPTAAENNVIFFLSTVIVGYVMYLAHNILAPLTGSLSGSAMTPLVEGIAAATPLADAHTLHVDHLDLTIHPASAAVSSVVVKPTVPVSDSLIIPRDSGIRVNSETTLPSITNTDIVQTDSAILKSDEVSS